MDKTIRAIEQTKDKAGYSGMVIPKHWKRLTLSLKVGKKIHVMYDEADTAMMIYCDGDYGPAAKSYLDCGAFSPPSYGAPTKVREAIRALGDRISTLGFRVGVREYCDSRILCGCCGADLKNPLSRQRGIGPKCYTTFHGMAFMQAMGMAV